jgi:hypothetical protein
MILSWLRYCYHMICLLNAIGLTPGGSTVRSESRCAHIKGVPQLKQPQ